MKTESINGRHLHCLWNSNMPASLSPSHESLRDCNCLTSLGRNHSLYWNIYDTVLLYRQAIENAKITAWLNVRTSVSRPWWRHQMKTFSALLALCAGNLPVPGEFPTQGPVTRSFDVFFDLRLNKRLNKQPWGWWFETPSWSLWRHCNDNDDILYSGGCFTSVNVSSTC